MEFVNKLTTAQVKEFIEETFGVKVKKLTLKDLISSRASCRFKTDTKAEFYFSFSDFRFDFPYVRFGANDKVAEIKKKWFSFLIKTFGRDYANALKKSIEQTIILEKELAKSRIELVKKASESKQNSLQTKIDLLTNAIEKAKEQEIADIEKEKQTLQQEIADLKSLQQLVDQEMEK